MLVEHYGELILPLRNADLNPDWSRYPDRYEENSGDKPRLPFTLWTSPVDSNWGWRHWCEGEMSEWLNCPKAVLELSDAARILTIDTYSDLERIVAQYKGTFWEKFSPYPHTDIDWKKVAIDYDAVHLTEHGSHSLHLSSPLDLNSWDCESIAIFRAADFVKVLEVISK